MEAKNERDATAEISSESKPETFRGKVYNTVSRSWLIKTDHPDFPNIELVRNEFTLQSEPLLGLLRMYSNVLFEVVNGSDEVPGRALKIIEVTDADKTQ